MLEWSVAEWGVENLQAEHVPVPEPGPGEVLVRFHAASLNFRDLLVVEGNYNPKFPRPLVPGSDGYGQIVALGSGVAAELFHRYVLTTLSPNWRAGAPEPSALRSSLGGPLAGVLCEYRTFSPEQLVFIDEPTALTPGEWATLPCAGVTAWNCLIDDAKLQPGQTVVLIGTGGVSLFGLQIARMMGARVLLLSSSPDKRERALQMGADAVADYTTREDWGNWVLEETAGRGADVILETGGAGTLAQSLRAVKVGGHVSLVGVLSGSQQPLNILPLVMKAVTVRGVVVGHQDHLRQLIRAYLQTFTRPVIDMAFALEALPEAMAHLASGRQFGKIVIEYPVEEEPPLESPPAV